MFVGIPVLIYALIAVFTLIPGRAKKRPRYRPGQPWEYPAQWWAGDQPVVAAADVRRFERRWRTWHMVN